MLIFPKRIKTEQTAPTALRLGSTSCSTPSISNVASAACFSYTPNEPRTQPDFAGTSAGKLSTPNASGMCSARSMARRRAALMWALWTQLYALCQRTAILLPRYTQLFVTHCRCHTVDLSFPGPLCSPSPSCVQSPLK